MGNFAENLNLGNRFRPPLHVPQVPQSMHKPLNLRENVVNRIARFP